MGMVGSGKKIAEKMFLKKGWLDGVMEGYGLNGEKFIFQFHKMLLVFATVGRSFFVPAIATGTADEQS